MGEPARNVEDSSISIQTQLPQGYRRVSGIDKVTAKYSEAEEQERIQERLREEFREFKVPESNFAGKGLRLRAKRPVAIRMSQGDEMWFAENDRLNIHAVGQEPIEAMREFETLVIHFYRYYKSLNENRALKGARELKARFIASFVEVGG